MSRDAGFPNADIDVGIFDDPKVRSLVRAANDECMAARCLVAFLATVTSSWARGERVYLVDAAPLWLTGLDDLAGQLQMAGLLNDERRIPERSWASWYGPAIDRRQITRERWRRANEKRQRGANVGTAPQPRGDSGDRPLRPSIQTDPSGPSAHSNGALGLRVQDAAGAPIPTADEVRQKTEDNRRSAVRA